MRNHNEELENIANDILSQNAESKSNENKPNYSNRDFMNILIIFNTALADKMFDLQTKEKMNINDRINMANQCGLDLKNLTHTYTGIDTHKIEEYL